ncbi:uncharacterized protein BDW43DRAFT_255818 [Aspergillus alliaceus]|uniref:uncharacterized protein n=1 Tax=Petromyces alliaceus TaxID=209559 RepID=UPI0012A3B2D5|nr:uncharacterized protein BDW43DRAFT_255818 [Aspergillus alliaceus]KAB8227253.1 hypothetical protein BDW43DRAFT_255818 [Aspergillus alliaceus]
MFGTGLFSAQLTFSFFRSEYTTVLAQPLHQKLIGVLTLPASSVSLRGNDSRSLARQAFAGIFPHCPLSFSWSWKATASSPFLVEHGRMTCTLLPSAYSPVRCDWVQCCWTHRQRGKYCHAQVFGVSKSSD